MNPVGAPQCLPSRGQQCVAPEMDLSSLWLLNPEETSPEIQNRGTSGPTKGHLSAKNVKQVSDLFKKRHTVLTVSQAQGGFKVVDLL